MRPVLLAALVLVPAVAAQPSIEDELLAGLEDEVRATVAALFDGMRAQDTTAIRATMHPDARLMTATGAGVAGSPIDAFLASVAGAPDVLDERLDDGYPVLLDGDLAVAWTPYRFYVGEAFSHCGTNAFTLARVGDAWQIVQVVDTRRRDCGEEDD